MKYGKVLTYADIEEAKKLIGKKVLATQSFELINENHGVIYTLIEVFQSRSVYDEGRFECADKDGISLTYQFIREVIEEEPAYRPFKNAEELCDHWRRYYRSGQDAPKGCMPLIWIRPKGAETGILVTEIWSNGVDTTFSGDTISWNELFEVYEFLDGSPVGVKE